MAHEIETYQDKAAAVFARVDAWHRLGTTVAGEAFTAEDALRLGHLGGWDVRKVALTATELSEDGVHSIAVPDHFATVRTSPFTGHPEALGVVGRGYTPLQNEEHCEFLNRLADESGAIFDTAGSLRGGRQVFVTMRLPETMRVGGVDDVTVNIAALNSHDGSSAFRLIITPVRVVCANTQAAAIRDHVSSVSIRHTRNATSAVQIARDALGLTFAYVDEFEAAAQRLINETMSEAQYVAMTRRLFGTPDPDARLRAQNAERERTATLAHLWHDASTLDGIRGTAWAGYQCITEYVDHHAPVRTRDDVDHARAARLLTTEEPNRLKRTAWDILQPA